MRVSWHEVTRLSQGVALLLFLLTLGIGFYLGMRYEALRHETSSTASPNLIAEVAFACQGKTIEARFYEDRADLTLSDGRTVSVPQTLAETGVRYANAEGTFVFSSQGENASIEEDGMVTFSRCAPTSVKQY